MITFFNLMPATGRVSQKQALESVKECVKRLWNTLKNNVPQHQIAKALQISSSTVHVESLCVRDKAEDLCCDARGLRALRRHCITHRHDSVIDITI